MSHLPTEKKVYYYIMEGSGCLFADERIKMHLIRLIGELHRRDEWLLIAFCIMDDAAYFIIEANKISQVARSLQCAARNLLQEPAWGRAVRRSSIELSGQTKKLDTLTEIANCCRKIHRIPLESGYVCRLEDYWWSSYPSYVGTHAWEIVDQRMLPLYFSTDPDAARKRLKQFHTSGEAVLNKKRKKFENMTEIK